MNIKLKKFKILEPKVKITTGLKAIIFDDNNKFTIQQLVENVSKSVTTDTLLCSIYSGDILTENSTRFRMFALSASLGVRTIRFSNNFKEIYCSVCIINPDTFRMIKGENAWYVTRNSTYYSEFIGDTETNLKFYGYRAFSSYHPCYANSVFLTIGEEKSINSSETYKIGDVFNTGISSTENITIVKFASGYWIYKYNGSTPIANFANNTYSFTPVSGVTRINLSNFIGKTYTDKASFSFTSSTGSYSVDLSTEELIVSTCDIVDSNGNVVFSKNANIEDYI